MYRFVTAAALVCAAFSASQAEAAGTVSVVSGIRGVTIASNGPVAQTFVATDALLTNFGFQFATSISGTTTGSVTFSLLSGAGTTGATLASQTVSLSGLLFRPSATAVGFSNVFTGSVGLTTGQTYTALLSGASANVSLLFGPDSTSTIDAYVPGYLIKNNSLDQACTNNAYCDANFRFTTAAAATTVPEPATWTLALAGIGLIGASMRYRRRDGKDVIRRSAA